MAEGVERVNVMPWCVGLWRREFVISCWWQSQRRFTAHRSAPSRSLSSWCCVSARNISSVPLSLADIDFSFTVVWCGGQSHTRTHTHSSPGCDTSMA